MVKLADISEAEKEQIYLKMLSVLAETGYPVQAIYYQLINGFSGWALSHIYRSTSQERERINNLPLSEVI